VAQSDAGIAAIVTLSNDTRGGRDGTHVVYGVQGDGSDCSPTFEGDEYIAVAWHDDAPIDRFTGLASVCFPTTSPSSAAR
jgi:hypothetical protein